MCIPGWKDAAKNLRPSAAFGHKVWLDCGHPTSAVLFQIKKNTKKRYKYEVRRLKRRRDHIAREKLESALSESCLRDF